MLWTASGLTGYAITASDGKLGTVSDFLFDDETWLVRWLVVDTGDWLPGRKVLLPPLVLGKPSARDREFPVGLTRQQVQGSPDINTDRPVSRQMEFSTYDYYGWVPYWGSGLVATEPPVVPPNEPTAGQIAGIDTDPNLRSVVTVTGYHIRAIDGEIGHVEDFLVQDADWSIDYLVVATRNWWPGKQVLISPELTSRIDWPNRLVDLDVDRNGVKGSPEYDSDTTVDRAYERRFHNYYGDIKAPGQT